MSKTRFSSEWLRERGLMVMDGKAVPVVKTPLKTAYDLLGEDEPKAVLPNLVKPLPIQKPKSKKQRNTQKSERLNGVESRFLQILNSRFPQTEEQKIQPQFRVRITPFHAPVLVHYTADFAVWTREKNWWTCRLWEVKDSRRRYHSDELIRPKMAAAENPWIAEIWLASWDGKAFTEKLLATNQQNQ